jgi:hypothetical protein
VTVRATKQLTGFLTAQARLNRRWLRSNMPGGPRPRDVIDQLAIERGREIEFQRRSVGRLARDLPGAMALPARTNRAKRARANAVAGILNTELRYAKLHTREMARRSLAAVTRAKLREESPEGAFWQLGHAKQHTGGCLFMAGHFWPWIVLDRVHPPRHAGCTSHLYSLHEAVARGWMDERDVMSPEDAVHRAAHVMMEGEAEALLAEVAVRDRLVELGADRELLDQIPWLGVLSEGFKGPATGSIRTEEADGTPEAVRDAA